MLISKNRTENQEIIKALIQGQQVQYKFKGDNWEDYDSTVFKHFGPWHCEDEYQWRIKPEKTSVTLTVNVTFKFEGIKKELYVKGEDIFYIFRGLVDDAYHKDIIRNVNHNEGTRQSSYIMFETEEAMDKAYEQIINAQKGSQ